MPRQTIDFGIDLGTTNSAIAVLDGTRADIIKNGEGGSGQECTPSVVMIDKKDCIHVGQAAKDRLFSDPENAVAEFKLQMGKDQAFVFKRGGRSMQPQDLSAEILKALVADVKTRMNEDIDAAVVTVPADFDLPQNAATNKAAELAGLRQCHLLQEPVAAALAYGFQVLKDKVFWLVYDFGGGTFDAAVIHLKDGHIEVVNHGGDKHLGGKLIDWAIVDQVLGPFAAREYGLKDFQRGNPKWIHAFAKLKQEAEKAKIRLSDAQSCEIAVDSLCNDEKGETVHFETDLSRRQVESIVEPFVERSIGICRKVLSEKRLEPQMIERLILVGGPTLTPCLRAMVADKARGLGIPLDFSVDPLTVVARGAAIYAGTQRLEARARAAAPAGTAALDLVYEPIAREAEPVVGGKVALPAGRSPAGFTIEFINQESKPPWRSGKIAVEPTGAFMSTLWADEGRRNFITVELRDPSGSQVPTSPDHLEITLGNRPGAAPLTHNVGVAMANGEVDVVIQKGAALPVRRKVVHRNVREVRKGSTDHVLRIPVVEGESKRAERNRLIGYVDVPGTGIPRDIPAQSEIEISIEMDSSRRIKTKAYIPLIDREFEAVVDLRQLGANIPLDQLGRWAQAARDRLTALRDRVQGLGSGSTGPGRGKAEAVLSRIEREKMEQNIEEACAAAHTSPDSADKCQLRVLDLQLALDEMEAFLEWPKLLQEAEDELSILADVAAKFGKRREDRETQTALERDVRAAIASEDATLLRGKIESVVRFRINLLAEQPAFWLGQLEWFESKRDSIRDQRKAEDLFRQARRGVDADNLEMLRGAVSQLFQLLPPDEAATAPFGGGTIR